MTIRKLKRSDFKGLLELYETGYKEVKDNRDYGDYLYLKKLPLNERKKRFDLTYRHVLDGHALYYVAEDKGRITGYCSVVKKDIPDSEISHVGVLGIRIAKEHRNKGVGTKLLEYTLKKSKGKFEIIEVFIMGVNDASKSLFKKFGFRKWGSAPRYVKRGDRYINMEYMYLRL
ncbi:MAG: GNAT family N-acetyltransferase [Candidatus Micrarchaeota archaeon]|nr:GNAT family N-acetyltransferase [Candidatus Micrarchaeota archaeon]MDE1852026.1 GNAT family N-acetyltransferase [Candidatus Micrarchaeota archaeon]